MCVPKAAQCDNATWNGFTQWNSSHVLVLLLDWGSERPELRFSRYGCFLLVSALWRSGIGSVHWGGFFVFIRSTLSPSGASSGKSYRYSTTVTKTANPILFAVKMLVCCWLQRSCELPPFTCAILLTQVCWAPVPERQAAHCSSLFAKSS